MGTKQESQNHKRQRSHRVRHVAVKGFTLVELLIVIAIIALLVSILLPSLYRAKELTRKVICLTRMKGITTGAHMHASEKDGLWPMADNDTNTDDWGKRGYDPWNDQARMDRELGDWQNNRWVHWRRAWVVALDAYVGLTEKTSADFPTNLSDFVAQEAVESAEVKQCPVWSGYPEPYRYNSRETGGGGFTANWSIGMNGFFHRGDEFNNIPNPGFSLGHSEPGVLKVARDRDIKYPSKTVAFADKVAYDTSPAFAEDVGTRPVVREEQVAVRHLGGANVGFCDGHASFAELETKIVTKSNTKFVTVFDYESWFTEVPDWHETGRYTRQQRDSRMPYYWNFDRPEAQ